jgi:hypothetical protein
MTLASDFGRSDQTKSIILLYAPDVASRNENTRILTSVDYLLIYHLKVSFDLDPTHQNTCFCQAGRGIKDRSESGSLSDEDQISGMHPS